MREPGPRPSRGPGWRPGQGPQPRVGNFLRKPAARQGLGGLVRVPGRGRESAKLLSGLGTDLAPRGFRGFLPPAVRPSGSPTPSRGFKPPAWTPVHAVRRGPRAAAEGSATFSSGPGPGRAPLGRGTTSPDGRLPQPGRGAMGGSLTRPGAGGQVLGEGRAASQTLPSCHRSLAAVGRPPARPQRPGSPAEGGRRSPSAPSPPAGRRLPGCRGSPRGFAPCGRRGCCPPGRWVALRSGWSLSCRSLPAVAH